MFFVKQQGHISKRASDFLSTDKDKNNIVRGDLRMLGESSMFKLACKVSF